MSELRKSLSKFPRAPLAHAPTPLEKLVRLSEQLDGHQIFVKRDDCTGLAMGGNKARQLEFYIGDALAKGCDTLLSTGAVQSNYMRILAAAAAKLGFECHIQLEERVDNPSDDYRHSGNVFLDHLFGARIHHYPAGEDEDGADKSIAALADDLAALGKKPYIVPLGMTAEPKGALGYVVAAVELIQQIKEKNLQIDLIAVGSGSGMTHAGILTGLRLSGDTTPVLGACVRRNAKLQHARIFEHCGNLGRMLSAPGTVNADEIWVDDTALLPGYGKPSDQVKQDMHVLATREGLLTDPVYSGKTFSCVMSLIRSGRADAYKNIVVVHTGGTPALFAYRDQMVVNAKV